MGASKWFFSMSGVILLIGALAIGGKGLNSASTSSPAPAIRAELHPSAVRERGRAT